RPRGHSKTSDLALLGAFLLAFSVRTLKGCVAAADRDQAKLLRDALATLVRLNPILDHGRTFTINGQRARGYLEVQANKVVNPRSGSELEVISSDVASSWGLIPDFIICDEVVVWRNQELWYSLISAAAKRKHCVVAVISNAGWLDTWQWEAREKCR